MKDSELDDLEAKADAALKALYPDKVVALAQFNKLANPSVVKALVAEVREKDERLAALEKQLAGLRCRKDKGARERDKTLEDVVDLMEALKASLGAGKRGRRF